MAYFYIKDAAILFVAWIVFIQIREWARWRSLKRFGDANGCGDLPVVSNKLPGGLDRAIKVFTTRKDFLEGVVRWRFNQMGCGTYRQYNLFNSSAVSTSDPENIQAILATKFHDFELGPLRRNNFIPILGHGIFTSEGEAWVHFRTQLRPQFTREQVSDLEAAERHLRILFRALPEENSSGWTEERDIMPLIFNFTLDVSTEFLFGRSVNSQTAVVSSPGHGSNTEVKKNIEFARALNFSQEYIGWRIRFQGLYWLANSKKFREACKTVKEFTDQFVRLALDSASERIAPAAGQKEKFVLLDSLVATTKNPQELRDQVLQILVAGRDTTSSLLSWTILLLSHHSEYFNYLHKTVLEHFGSEIFPGNEMNFSSLKACKPLQNVLYESLRLYPLIPLNGRTALRDTILPVGGGKNRKQPIAIAKGEQISYSAYVLHRRKDIWGEDADEFRPERWDGRKIRWEFLGFSGGPRVCLGQQYALNEAAFVVARLLQRYDKIESPHISKPLRKNLTTTLSPSEGVKVKLHRAIS